MEEIWRDVKGYEGIYQVSNLGRVKSLHGKGRIRKLSTQNSGYAFVKLHKKGDEYQTYVHRLVAKAFIPNPDNLPAVNHKNGVKSDNTVGNLEWVTYSQNNYHAHEVGLKTGFAGETNSQSKITEIEVLEIRRLLNTTNLKQKEIAAMFGLHERYISLIKTNRRWSHI